MVNYSRKRQNRGAEPALFQSVFSQDAPKVGQPRLRLMDSTS